MQGFMDHGRQALGVKGKRKHKKKRLLTVMQTLIGAGGTTFEAELPFDMAWKVMTFPLLSLPRVLDPDKDLTDEEGVAFMGAETLHFGVDGLTQQDSSSVSGAKICDSIALFSFVRLLAKIAHGYHVSVYGMFPLHESPLIPIIQGHAAGVQNWIGGLEGHPLPSDRPSLHLLAVDALEGGDGSTCMAVRIKLFASHGAPTYVATSRLIASQSSAAS